MSDKPLFQDSDEQERKYAPEQLSAGERPPAVTDEGGAVDRSYLDNEAPAAAPVANVGNSPTGSAAPPNIGHEDHGGAAGDPETEAEYPIGDTPDRHAGESSSR